MKVRLYVEGGPIGYADGLRLFKNNFKQHLLKLEKAPNTLDVSPCGSTEQAIKDFARAAKERGTDWVLALLVDADAEVTTPTPAHYLASKLDAANVPHDVRKNIFLMVQCMESWFVTDKNAVEKCYGARAKIKLPANTNIEAVPKADVFAALNEAAKGTPAKRYHKVRDAVKILAVLQPGIVASRSSRAKELHDFLRDQ